MMVRLDTITLIRQTPSAHGIFDTVEETRREVYAEVQSVGMSESYQAMSQGLAPEVRFKLTVSDDYEDEVKAEWRGKLYRVLRTYATRDGGIELTCGRWSDDV